jgi:general secretion pathway protein K
MTIVDRRASVPNRRPPVTGKQPFFALPAEDGVILIAILWVFVAIAVIALSFSKESFVEVASARNSQSMESSYYAARAGMMGAIYQIIQKRMLPSVQQQGDQEPDPIDLGTVTGKFGNAVYRVDVQDDSGRISLNAVQADQLRALADVIKIPQNDADIIVDSIMDWKDANTTPLANGAEDDYYQTLNPPYKAKNKNFDTLEELLLVKGVTPDYFYGHLERSSSDGSIFTRYGLSRYLTVYSSRQQVNVNYAPLAVLKSIPGLSEETAQSIYNRRLTKPFKTLDEITRDLAINLGDTGRYLMVAQTNIYFLTASARVENSRVQRVLRAVVNCPDLSSDTRYKILYWNENVSDYEGVTQ